MRRVSETSQSESRKPTQRLLSQLKTECPSPHPRTGSSLQVTDGMPTVESREHPVVLTHDEEAVKTQHQHHQIENLLAAFPNVSMNDVVSCAEHMIKVWKNNKNDQIEIHAILSNSMHREFYLSMHQRLRCATQAIDCLSSGLISKSEGVRSTLVDAIHNVGGIEAFAWDSLGKLTTQAISQAISNAPCPGSQHAASFFDFLCSLANSHEETKSFVRVSAFCTLCDLVHKNEGGASAVLERMARLTVRYYLSSGKFQSVKDYWWIKRQVLNFCGAKGRNVPIKECGYEAAQAIIEHISNPKAKKDDSLLFQVYKGQVRETSITDYSSMVVAEVFGVEVDDVVNLPIIEMESSNSEDSSEMSLPYNA